MATRREFHKGLLGLALASLAGGRAGAENTAESGLVYLNRLTFGATKNSLAAFNKIGPTAWLEAELAKPESDTALDVRLATARLLIDYEAGQTYTNKPWDAVSEMRRFTRLNSSPESALPYLDFAQPFAYAERERPGNEVIAASFIRATHADAQLREVMTQFWHEHFSVNALKSVGTAAFFPAYDRIMRRHAFGNFRALLGEVSRAPAMLYYLDNASSKASPANENFARELLELHTLGAPNYLNDYNDNWREVPGAEEGLAVGYVDQDVYEVARAFTGWTVGDGEWSDDNGARPKTGAFYYAERWHDPYQKRFLGVEFEANAAPMVDGEKVLDMLARHPATARFVSEKILRRLGLESPSDALKAQVARVFANAVQDDDQIAQVIRAIVLSEEFAATPPSKLRRPMEFVMALFRATGTQVFEPQTELYWEIEYAGWTQHQVRPPTGHSDLSADWANTRALNGMVEFALYGLGGWIGGVEFDHKVAVNTWGEYGTHWIEALMAPPDVVKTWLKGMGFDASEPFPDDDGYQRWGATNAIALAALTPDFMFR